MPTLDRYIIDKLKAKDNYSIFIETGTLIGETILSMEDNFNKLYTIEIDETLYNNIKKNYNRNKINFILGDSTVIFQQLLPTIKQNTIFFLDGHYSGGNTGFGKIHVPLYDEISLINCLTNF